MTDDDLWKTEERFWLDGPGFYGKHMDTNAQMVFADPVGILKGAGILDSLEGAPRWDAVRLEDRSCVRAGSAAVLAYRATGSRAGSEPYRALCSSTYVQRDGIWMLISHQQTPAGGGGSRP